MVPESPAVAPRHQTRQGRSEEPGAIPHPFERLRDSD